MPHYTRTCIVLLLALLPVVMAWAVDAGLDTLDARKSEAVSQALAGEAAGALGVQAHARVARALALTSLRVENAPGEVCLFIAVPGSPVYTAHKSADGRTITLTLRGTIAVCEDFPSDYGWPAPFQSVRADLISVAPEFLSAVVITLTAPTPYYIETTEDGIQFTAAQMSPARGGGSPLDELAAQLTEVRGMPVCEKPVFDSLLDAVRMEQVAADLAAVRAPHLDYTRAKEAPFAAVDEGAAPAADASGGESPSDTPAADTAESAAGTETSNAEEEAPVTGDQVPPGEEVVPQPEEPVPPAKREPEPPVDTTAANEAIAETMRTLIKGLASGLDSAAEQGLKSSDASQSGGTAADQGVKNAAAGPSKPAGNPLDQLVDFECDEMPLTKVVPLLAYKAGINVVAGADLAGNVTMSLKSVPLRKAIETALRMNGLGLIEEDTIYRIVPYEEAMSDDRETMMVSLESAKAQEVRKVLEEILKGTRDQDYINISANDTANVVVISGPVERIQTLVSMVHQLDVAEPVLPTVTTPIKLNYAEPEQLVPTIEKMLTPKIGNVAADMRARHLIVTDVPVVIEQVRELVTSLDIPVKQVMLDTMVVDAALNDEAETGVDWLLSAVRSQSYRDFIEQGPDGPKISSLQELGLASAMPMGTSAGKLTFGLLTSKIDWKGVLQAEVRNRNGHLISNPVVVTVENKPATITISQEIPYIELSQSSGGGSQTNTQFKQVGTVLEVTPRVTHNNQVIVDINGKESATNGEFNGIPIEDQRKVQSTLRMDNGQTIFVGGLRKRSDNATVKKLPVLGNVPVMNFLFRTNARTEQVNELMIFLTCRVIEDMPPELDGTQQSAYDTAKGAAGPPDAEGTVKRDILHPERTMDPAWKWRRAQ